MLGKKLYKNIEELISEENGSSMLEFALVLPMLVVLTMGGVYFSVSFGQKSVMNGIAFLETRAGSVRLDYAEMATKAKESYLKNTDSKQKWVLKTDSKLTVLDYPDKSKDLKVVVSMNAMRIDILSNSLSALGRGKPAGTPGNPANNVRKITSYMMLPVEYSFRSSDTGSSKTDRPPTYKTVDYETKPVMIGNLFEKYVPAPIMAVLKNNILVGPVDPKIKEVGQVQDIRKMNDAIISTNPRCDIPDKPCNMRRLNSIYRHWGMDYPDNPAKDSKKAFSEIPLDKDLLSLNPMTTLSTLNSMSFLEVSGNYIKEIETAVDIGKIALNTTPAGAAVDKVLTTISQVGQQVLPDAQNTLTSFADAIENNNNRMFKNVKSPVK